MGKKARRKTRWRRLSIGDASGGEEETGEDRDSSTPTPHHRRTRRSPQPTEKITFNEDEYTRITTPRQDVLFKKGYLAKRKVPLPPPTPAPTAEITNGNASSEGSPDPNQESVENTASEAGDQGSTEPDTPPLVYTNGYANGYTNGYTHNGYCNGYVDPGVVYVNGSYDYYDPYSGNMVTVMTAPHPPFPGAPPLLAAVPCQPVPLQPIEWYPPRVPPHFTPMSPAAMTPQPLERRRKRNSTDSQNCSSSAAGTQSSEPGTPATMGSGSPSAEDPLSPVETEMAPPIFMSTPQGYVYPGYMFGPAVYGAVNGVVLPAAAPLPPDAQLKRRKRRRRRRRRRGYREEGATDDGTEESTSEGEEEQEAEAASMSQSGSSEGLQSPPVHQKGGDTSETQHYHEEGGLSTQLHHRDDSSPNVEEQKPSIVTKASEPPSSPSSRHSSETKGRQEILLSKTPSASVGINISESGSEIHAGHIEKGINDNQEKRSSEHTAVCVKLEVCDSNEETSQLEAQTVKNRRTNITDNTPPTTDAIPSLQRVEKLSETKNENPILEGLNKQPSDVRTSQAVEDEQGGSSTPSIEEDSLEGEIELLSEVEVMESTPKGGSPDSDDIIFEGTSTPPSDLRCTVILEEAEDVLSEPPSPQPQSITLETKESKPVKNVNISLSLAQVPVEPQHTSQTQVLQRDGTNRTEDKAEETKNETEPPPYPTDSPPSVGSTKDNQQGFVKHSFIDKEGESPSSTLVKGDFSSSSILADIPKNTGELSKVTAIRDLPQVSIIPPTPDFEISTSSPPIHPLSSVQSKLEEAMEKVTISADTSISKSKVSETVAAPESMSTSTESIGPITEAVTRWLETKSLEEALTVPKETEIFTDEEENGEEEEEEEEEVEEVKKILTGPKNVYSNPSPAPSNSSHIPASFSNYQLESVVCDGPVRRVGSGNMFMDNDDQETAGRQAMYDPANFSKYYQFGIQIEAEELDECDDEEEVLYVASPPPPTTNNSAISSQLPKHENETVVASTTSRVLKTPSQLPNQEDKIGTVLSTRLSTKSSHLPQRRDEIVVHDVSDIEDDLTEDVDTIPHMYDAPKGNTYVVNDLSLATEVISTFKTLPPEWCSPADIQRGNSHIYVQRYGSISSVTPQEVGIEALERCHDDSGVQSEESGDEKAVYISTVRQENNRGTRQRLPALGVGYVSRHLNSDRSSFIMQHLKGEGALPCGVCCNIS